MGEVLVLIVACWDNLVAIMPNFAVRDCMYI